MGKSPRPEKQTGRLPVPYTNPWVSLREGFRDVFADLGLRLRQLWRLNRQGEFSTPRFWPSAMAPMFWPLTLATVLVLGVFLSSLLIDQPAAVAQLDPAETYPSNSAALAVMSSPSTAESEPVAALSEPSELESTQLSAPLAVPLQLEPLLTMLADNDLPSGLLLAAEPRPLDNDLVLRLSPVWNNINSSRQRELADRWQALAEQLGYDELQLQSEDDQLLARTARVGVGMIIFDQDLA
ncbi:hypothetical protein PMIT1342_00736 [Prochlorococcus marinus str. MIT 1342]|uniref:hypothetical protein n=1 Tax=Prochlorococcus TaxID=1218 RepID=UPI0007B34131|nr:hypothetical protein [Prochlorococcus marinus]KZR82272.1 hypothetical protein PMIT1342_00736 [Prochlorococcus marinus str. MIT 1342]